MTKQVGSRYIVHLQPQKREDGLTECYECMTDSTPDIEGLAAELEVWKAERTAVRASRDRKARMKEIQAELASTDYLALKDYEGEDMSDHPQWKEHRAALRAEYRQLEAQEQEP